MGREVRMVKKDWEHPKDKNTGRYIPLFDGKRYEEEAKEFLKIANKEGLQEALDYMCCPDKNNYMPCWDDAERTHLMMYEDTSEGTPISPAFETPEELARWLSDNGASAFGSMTATYEQWLSTCKMGFAVSAVLNGKELISGVEFNE